MNISYTCLWQDGGSTIAFKKTKTKQQQQKQQQQQKPKNDNIISARWFEKKSWLIYKILKAF